MKQQPSHQTSLASIYLPSPISASTVGSPPPKTPRCMCTIGMCDGMACVVDVDTHSSSPAGRPTCISPPIYLLSDVLPFDFRGQPGRAKAGIPNPLISSQLVARPNPAFVPSRFSACPVLPCPDLFDLSACGQPFSLHPLHVMSDSSSGWGWNGALSHNVTATAFESPPRNGPGPGVAGLLFTRSLCVWGVPIPDRGSIIWVTVGGKPPAPAQPPPLSLRSWNGGTRMEDVSDWEWVLLCDVAQYPAQCLSGPGLSEWVSRIENVWAVSFFLFFSFVSACAMLHS